jgi:hypothetical protein
VAAIHKWKPYIHMSSTRKKKMEAPIYQTLAPFTCNYKVFGLRGVFILLNFYLSNERKSPYIASPFNNFSIKYYKEYSSR